MAVVYNRWTGMEWWTCAGLLDSKFFSSVFKYIIILEIGCSYNVE